MSGASPLAAQANPSATRTLSATEVAPGGALTVMITLSDLTGNLGTVTETLPSGFTYVSSSLSAAQVSQSGQDVTFTLLGQASFTYNVTASSTEGSYNISGELAAGGSTFSIAASAVEVSAGATPPPPPDPGDGSLAVSSAVDDFDLYLMVSGANDSDTPGSKAITLSGSGGVFSGGDDAKAYTAMTTAPMKVAVALAGNYSSTSAPTNGAVAAWWDGLSDSDKIANLNLDTDQTNGDNDTCDVSLCAANAGTALFGGGDTIRDYAEAIPADLLMITQAFHWDLLSGAEMYAAAYANGLDNPADYKKAFRGLSDAERANVEALYAAGVLQRGSGNTLTATAGNGTDSDGDGRADNVGSATVTVKVADSDGPDLTDSAHAVGDSFDVEVMYHPLDSIGDVTLTAADSSVVISADSSAVTISDTTAGKIATVNAAVVRAPYQQLINYSLANGSGLGYNIDGGNGTSNDADLVIKAGSSASDASFTIVVNEEGRSANRSTLDVSVTVASGNMAPSFNDSALDAATAGVTILEFMAGDDRTPSGLPIDFGANASDSDNQVLSYSISPMNKGLKIDSATGVVSFDNSTGVAASSVEYTVSVSDGTLSDTYSFTANITTNKATADTSDDRVTSATTAEVTIGTDTKVPQDGRNVPVVDLAGLLMPVHDVSALDIQIIAPTGLPFTLDGTELQLASVPDARPDYILEYDGVKITFDDGYDGDGPDLTLTLKVTVHVAEPPTVGAIQRSINIYENTSGVLEGTANLYDPQGSGVDPYYHYTAGTGGASFSVDTGTGEVTLDAAQDFEDGDNAHTLTIFVRDGDEVASILAVINIAVSEHDVNEAPVFDSGAASSLNVDENAQPGTKVGDPITAADQDAGATVAYSISESGLPFSVDSASGQISVSGALDLTASPYSVTLVATDNGGMTDEHSVSISVGDINDPPKFDQPAQTTASIAENTAAGTVVATYNATDVDGSDTLEGIHYELRDADDLKNFDIMVETSSDGEIMGKLVVKDGANLDVDADGAATSYTVEVNVKDADDADSELVIVITVTDVNDNAPMFATDNSVIITVVENAARGTALTSAIASGGVYAASDADLTAPNNTISYGIDSKSFHIDSSTGMLTVLESLDADSNTPCGATGCQFKITAMDGGDPSMSDTLDVTVNVTNAEDSVSTFKISKANPVPGVSMGDAYSALADTKTGMYGIDERPSDQPATGGDDVDAPVNFVEADWANWGTVVRVEVTAESPDDECGNGNQCVYVDVESDSAGNELRLAAYRSANQENLFITAVKLVEDNPTDDGDGKDGDRNDPVYKDASGGVVRLEADEEDEITFRLVGSTAPPIAIDVENELPEFSNFMPEHEAAFDDGDVEYTFTVIDSVSGIPEPEDLAGDTDGDGDYMPLVALISDSQCHSKDPNDSSYSMYDFAGNSLWCKSAPEIRQVVDDRDFDEVDEGFEVATKIVLDENVVRYVTFIVCDNAGNCAMYTPDQNDTDEALAQITIDTVDPKLVEARTGIKWDDIDEELDDNNKTWIQVIFEDLSPIDEDTVEKDDFVVEGHTVKDVNTYGDDADEGSGENARRMVFIELEDELAPDETPDVTLVPNGIADKAGNEQDDGEAEAKDYIAPSFTVVSIVAPRTPEGSSNQLAGDDDEVVITITSDERIVETRPSVTVSYVNAPSGSVYTKVGTADTCDDDGNDDGKRVRGEIVNNDNCQDSDAADGSALGTTIQKVSNTEWVVMVDEPESTGYYNIYISGHDRSSQRNQGDEGVAPADIVTDFFERDGDVNADDAHFFQGDINLSNPGVRVSGVQIEDTEPTIEFKTPLFVELDFTRAYIADCADDVDDDERNANCYAESDEYAKDSFDSVTVTSFTLDGTDITDSVKTTDDETFLVSLEGIEIGDHEIEIQAMDQAGNKLDKTLSVEFEVEERDPFDTRLNPGWNLVSLPGEPADSDISVVFGSDMEVRTVYTYNPIIPGGWMVAVRESSDSEWQGDLTEITARQGYWVLSDAIQDWEVSIPRLAGGAVGSGTPIQPPVIALYAGWNLVPVIDVTGDFAGGGISAQAYLQSLDDGLDLARVLGFDTITNKWSTVMAPEGGDHSDTLEFGKAYWVFVRQPASLVPGN